MQVIKDAVVETQYNIVLTTNEHALLLAYVARLERQLDELFQTILDGHVRGSIAQFLDDQRRVVKNLLDNAPLAKVIQVKNILETP